jgi:GNAT superfamily N-acetyltransferase
MQDHDAYRLSEDLSTIDWWRLANIMADANLFNRKPFDIARAFHGSYAAVFAFKGEMLVGAARATSDGVFYASVFDVVIAPDHQGNGAGRMIMERLLERLFGPCPDQCASKGCIAVCKHLKSRAIHFRRMQGRAKFRLGPAFPGTHLSNSTRFH